MLELAPLHICRKLNIILLFKFWFFKIVKTNTYN